MTDREQNELRGNGEEHPSPKRHGVRRRRTLIGASSATAILVGGVFLTARLEHSPGLDVAGPPALAPASTASSEAASASLPASTSGAATSRPAVTTRTSTTPEPRSAEPRKTERESLDTARESRTSPKAHKEVLEARAAAAADGVKLQRPLKEIAKAGDSAVQERTQPISDGTIRVVTARHDLTGQRDMLFAGDKGKAVGQGVRCTNKVRFAEGQAATERPTILLCWRTSSTRSVVTLAVTPRTKPSTATSLDVIRAEWDKLA